ncbi:MAG TPA: tungstate ABC transporter substrate-binding protein WtpA [Gemmatimonadaceae bacterium]|nr:tungstate ABC transporter substrate-binding protein WtpA [Gemmatimonadaceae bacterium]
MRRFIGIGLVALACSRGDERGTNASAGDQGPLVVFNAGSLARPIRAALDTFAAREGVPFEQEQAGSLETARKLTELGRVPDIIALADYKIFPQLLVPEHATWHARFARNRMVLAHTARSRHADVITPSNWWQIVLRPGVETGHSDPDLDPAGYRSLLVMQLAERYYRQRGLASRLEAAIPARNVRPKEIDLVALLETGELDYAFEYESVARGASLEFVALPDSISLGNMSDSAFYQNATVRVVGRRPGDSLTIRGEPIVYALSIPRRAPHPRLAERFVDFLMSEDGRRILRANHLDALGSAVVSGEGAPASLSAQRPPAAP